MFQFPNGRLTHEELHSAQFSIRYVRNRLLQIMNTPSDLRRCYNEATGTYGMVCNQDLEQREENQLRMELLNSGWTVVSIELRVDKDIPHNTWHLKPIL